MKRKQLHARLKKASNKTGQCLKTVAWQTCKCVLWTACAPCLCCALICLPRRRRRHVGEQQIEYEYPQFPAPRQRALSLPLVNYKEDQTTLDQSQSDFMTKLPLELRRMVYEHALGGVTVHLQTCEGRPRARRCQDKECQCDYFDPIAEQSLEFGLGLLRTCRSIYSEAVEYLYSANSFSFSTDRDEQTTVNYLSHYFLPQRLAQIRDLRFYWYLDVTPFFLMSDMLCPSLEPWAKSWDALSRLSGLRKLHIILEYRYAGFDDCYEKMWKERETELLAAIKPVTVPRDFVVVLPDRRCTTSIDVGPSRCVLKLPERPLTGDTL